MKALLLACFVAVVFCGRLCIVFYAGSPIPFHDQWYAEAQELLIPLANHALGWGNFFAPHGDHVIAPTRAIALLLVMVEGKWDCITQMVVNSAISPFCLLPMLSWALDRINVRGASVLCLVTGVIYGSPLFYGNIIWGFQSQILLMIALSISHLYLVTVRPGGRIRWCLGMLCGLLAAVSFASGFLAAVVSALGLMTKGRRLRVSRRYLVGTLIGCVGVMLIALWLTPKHPGLKDLQPGNVLHTFVHALSFPDRFYSYWGFFFWAPTGCALALAMIRRETMADGALPLAAAIWVLCQVLIISVGRSEPAIVLAPRYYDVLMVGVLANCLLAIELVGLRWVKRSTRITLRIGFVIWIVAVGYKTARFVDSHTRGDIPVLVSQATQQIGLVAHFYEEHQNVEVLRSRPFPIRALPDADLLGQILGWAEIKSLWPDYIFSWRPNGNLRRLPWIGEHIPRENWFRASLLIGVVAGVVLYIASLWSLFEKRTKIEITRSGLSE